MLGTPAAADAIDPRNCPRCDHGYAIALAGAYRLTEHFRGTDSPVWVEPVASPVETVAVPSADEVADGQDFAQWLESAADRVRTRLNGTLSSALVRIPHEPGETVACEPVESDAIVPPVPSADDRTEFDAWLSDRSAMCAEVYDAEALPETRDDGALYHGRVPSEDCDAFNPCVIARAGVGQIVPPPADGQSIVPAWAYQTAGVA